MKSIIEITYLEVMNQILTKEFIKDNPMIKNSTEKLTKKISDNLKKYLKDQNIQVSINYKIED